MLNGLSHGIWNSPSFNCFPVGLGSIGSVIRRGTFVRGGGAVTLTAPKARAERRTARENDDKLEGQGPHAAHLR